MAGRESGAGVVPVERAELVTQDMELIAELISQLYVEHRARFGCADPSRDRRERALGDGRRAERMPDALRRFWI